MLCKTDLDTTKLSLTDTFRLVVVAFAERFAIDHQALKLSDDFGTG